MAAHRRSRTPRRLGTSEARASFSTLVNELAARKRPSESLLDQAIEIGPQRKGGAFLVPEVDARAAVLRIEELEDELENIAFGFLIEERLQRSGGETVPAAQVIRELGFEDLAKALPE